MKTTRRKGSEEKHHSVVEFPLFVTGEQQGILLMMLRAKHKLLKQIYWKMINRKAEMKRSITWQKATSLFKRSKIFSKIKGQEKVAKELYKEASLLYRKAEEDAAFYHPEGSETSYSFGKPMDVQGLARPIRNKDPFICTYLNSAITAAICDKFTAAWVLVKEMRCKDGSPAEMRIPAFSNSLPSHITATKFILNKENPVKSYIKYGQLELQLSVKELDFKQKIVLIAPIRGVSLKRRFIHGHIAWFGQVMVEAAPLVRDNGHPITESVGVDVGTAHIAVASETNSYKVTLSNNLLLRKLLLLEKERRRVNRAMDRSRRDMNPSAFDEKGRWIKGYNKPLIRSKRYQRLRHKRQELERQVEQIKKHIQGKITNDIFPTKAIFTEDVSTKEWQEGGHGKSVAKFAPGQFITTLQNKAKARNVPFMDINTYHTRLSQYCCCGNHIGKAPLEIRTRTCTKCNRVFDRDIMAAHLARFVEKVGDTYSINWSKVTLL